ncbi:MAG: NEW3 domain-containing protein [Acidimicrobiia bacterium]
MPGELSVTAPYPRVAVEAGDQASFDLSITAPEPTEVALAATGLPDGWDGAFRGGGFEVDGVTAAPTAPEVSFDVTVPVDAMEGTYDLAVTATGGGASTELALQVRVSAQAGGEVTLTPDFPGLRTPAGEAATFSVELRNDTPTDLQFELDSAGPAGWEVTAQPSTESQASTIQVDSGSTATINVAATSPARAEAGQYSISVQATSPETEVSAEMIVEIVGSFSLELTTVDQRLSTEVSADGSSELELVVTNTGTAPIQGIEMSSTPPSGWDVSFAQPGIAELGAGQSVSVVATITPSDQAIAGDYVITFSAVSEQARSEVDIRTTVNPSALWGFVGIGLIALTLAGLAWVFRRFGRR